MKNLKHISWILLIVFIAGAKVFTQDHLPFEAINAIKFEEIKPNLSKSSTNLKFNSSEYLKFSNTNLEKSMFFNRADNNINIIDSDGSILYTFDLSENQRIGHYAWNHSGSKLCVVLREKLASALIILNENMSEEKIKSVSGRVQILQPSWAFDDNSIVFIKSGRNIGSEIWVMNIKTKNEILIEKVERGNGVCSNPVWFNKKNKLIYRIRKLSATRKLKDELWSYDLITNKKLKLYEGKVETPYPTISPDDMQIGFDSGSTFSIIDELGTMKNEYNFGSNTNVAWSENGKFITFLKGKIDPKGETLIENHIYIFDISSKSLKNLTPKTNLIIDEYRWLNDETIVY